VVDCRRHGISETHQANHQDAHLPLAKEASEDLGYLETHVGSVFGCVKSLRVLSIAKGVRRKAAQRCRRRWYER
jgi:hypothetical protein